jgi:hypothetical protein
VNFRHHAAKSMHDAGKFDRDIAATDNHDPAGQAVKVKHFVGCYRELATRYLGHRRPSTGRDQDVAG